MRSQLWLLGHIPLSENITEMICLFQSHWALSPGSQPVDSVLGHIIYQQAAFTWLCLELRLFKRAGVFLKRHVVFL